MNFLKVCKKGDFIRMEIFFVELCRIFEQILIFTEGRFCTDVNKFWLERDIQTYILYISDFYI